MNKKTFAVSSKIQMMIVSSAAEKNDDGAYYRKSCNCCHEGYWFIRKKLTNYIKKVGRFMKD